MLNIGISNYTDFREVFGRRENGERKNKILLAAFKSKAMRLSGVLRGVKSMPQLETATMDAIEKDGNGEFEVKILGRTFRSGSYKTDEHDGICEDHSTGHIRVWRKEEDGRLKLYKSKSGKLLRFLINETRIGECIPEELKNYLCETFTLAWSTHIQEVFPKYTLVIDQDFERIYSSNECIGSFGSCMVDENQHGFYENSVKAHAAYLVERESSKIVARAIIYDEVYDETDNKTIRLLERQYSSGSDETLKLLLVNKCIAAGAIDGYKAVGAGCREAHAFRANDGSPMTSHRLSIECTLRTLRCHEPLGPQHKLSYQDSFKWYSESQHKAWNYEHKDREYELDTTSDYIYHDCCYDNRNYDEYHDQYTSSDLVSVYYNGRWMTCADDELDEFEWNEQMDGYVHHEYYSACPWCGELIFDGTSGCDSDGVYSELLDQTYCCERCKDAAELDYKRDYWLYSDLCDEYFETEEELDAAELKFKQENWFHSELLDEYFRYLEDMQRAELAYKEQHAA